MDSWYVAVNVLDCSDVAPIHRGETRGVHATRIFVDVGKQVSLRAIGIGDQQL